MANIIGIMGESGHGKTTSMRELPPETTYYMDCDKKGLSWKGWKKSFNVENKNYCKTDFPQVVMKALKWLNGYTIDGKGNAVKDPNSSGLKYKVAVIDTINGLMVADEMRRMKEKNYDKWMDLAASIYDIIDYALTMRDDITVIFTAHTQTERDDSGFSFTRIKTSGKKLDKIVLESKFPTVLYARKIDGEFWFETQAENSTAKSPMGLFDDFRIPNNINLVLKAFEEF